VKCDFDVVHETWIMVVREELPSRK
jgi:hypothetical protein